MNSTQSIPTTFLIYSIVHLWNLVLSNRRMDVDSDWCTPFTPLPCTKRLNSRVCTHTINLTIHNIIVSDVTLSHSFLTSLFDVHEWPKNWKTPHFLSGSDVFAFFTLYKNGKEGFINKAIESFQGYIFIKLSKIFLWEIWNTLCRWTYVCSIKRDIEPLLLMHTWNILPLSWTFSS